MSTFFISHLTIKNLWGEGRNISVPFRVDMNILIGPNASGKTTIINILHQSLTANLSALSQLQFDVVSIRLQAYQGDAATTIEVVQHNDTLTFKFLNFFVEAMKPELLAAEEYRRTYLGRSRFEHRELRRALAASVPAVWLPVTRRLPISDEEEAERRMLHNRPLESVDECLADLLAGLRTYRLSLDARLANLRKVFQHHALDTILYDKRHDQMHDWNDLKPPTKAEKDRLLQAFKDVGFYGPEIEKRIQEHFAAAEDAIRKLRQGNPHYEINTFLILPLITRTTTMVQRAQELEQKRAKLFEGLNVYKDTVNSFLRGKMIDVSDRGELAITYLGGKDGVLEWRHLSSGEKQILILLTQAFLRNESPVVYVADEPELSLHVSWQEKLLKALTRLAGKCQFIVATHSPDIAGAFRDRIINLEKV